MDLSLRVSKAQENIGTIKSLIGQWNESPIFTRNEDSRNGEGLLNLKEAAEIKKKRYDEVEQAAGKIISLVEDCQKYFQANTEAENWRKYLHHIDEVSYCVHGNPVVTNPDKPNSHSSREQAECSNLHSKKYY